MENYRLIPEKYRFLSGSGLKLIAVITMLIDHTASVLLRKNTTVLFSLYGHELTLYYFMRCVGRLAFPLYAFLLVEGFHHTRSRERYGRRLLLFALLSEIPWNLEHSGVLFGNFSQNVFFTLFLGFLGLCLLDKLKEERDRRRNCIALLFLFVLSCLLHADYGASGFGFILMLGLLNHWPVYRAVVGSCFLSSGWRAGLAFIPIAFYNGKRGLIRSAFAKYLFYAIYPLHMLALYFIKKALIGY